MLLCLAYVVGFGVNLTWTAFSLSALILEDTAQLEHAWLINLALFVAVALCLLPSVGYAFYRVPVDLAMANLFGALFYFVTPVLVSGRHESVDADALSAARESLLVCVVVVGAKTRCSTSWTGRRGRSR